MAEVLLFINLAAVQRIGTERVVGKSEAGDQLVSSAMVKSCLRPEWGNKEK